jgi:hypothetical protein
MQTLIPLILAALIVAFFAGCATAGRTQSTDATLIQGVLDKMLPPDFAGPIDVSHVNQYFTIAIKAGNVHRNADGKWTWDWLEYERNSHFPLFSGLTWSSTGKVRLGNPQQPVVK